MVPESAIFVVSHDDHHVTPLRALLQERDQLGEMRIAGVDVGVSGMLVQIPLRLVKGHLFEFAFFDGFDEVGAGQSTVLEMFGALGGTGSHSGEIVEGLVVILEIGNGGGVVSF